MATITAYQTKAGKRYRVRYRKPDRSQTDRRGFKTMRDAKAFAATVETSKLMGTYIDPSAGRVTIGQLGEAWIGRQADWKPSYATTMRQSWGKHVDPRWGGTAVADVRRSQVEEWIAGLGLSNSVATRCLTILSSILESAVADHLIPANPARGVPVPRRIPKPRVYLTHQQVARLAAAAGARGVIVDMLAYTGLRWGELAGLHGPDVDLVLGRVSVHRNAVEVGSHVILGTPKGHELRSVPLPGFLVAELRGRVPAGIVFPGSDGGYARAPRTSATRKSWLKTAVLDAGVPMLSPHDLRHTAASLAISAGANVKAVQRMLGHKSAALTLDTYSDLFPDDLQSVAVALDAARERAV
ncbi:site-specific integrase [Brevibacterium sp. 91QC2O2]|uniref:tyrosine-type recombinase/integrase n=1 Tax=Brevibacterium sp. 91QC2O2 TaxID=2968458 RepID=UPI00211B9E2E|nr:site-specific integrase [Brevibacterium sp. 91QC2O2]MCQ9367984.1 site-specific integrase [Brevibacterium sp. 91QC2O2]